MYIAKNLYYTIQGPWTHQPFMFNFISYLTDIKYDQQANKNIYASQLF